MAYPLFDGSGRRVGVLVAMSLGLLIVACVFIAMPRTCHGGGRRVGGQSVRAEVVFVATRS